MSSNNNSDDSKPTSFFTTLKESLAPHDQRRLSRGSSSSEQQQRQNSADPRRRTSDASSTNDSSTSNASTTATTALEAHRDATGAGSHFLEDLTPGRQRRRRSSVLEALGNTLGSSTARQRRSSVGAHVEEQQQGGYDGMREGAGAGKETKEFFRFVQP